MELDGLGSLLMLLLHWRVLACLLPSILIAVGLVHLFPWFSGLQGVVLVIFGLVAGLILETWIESAGKEEETTQQAPVWAVCVAALFAGAIWGGASGTSSHSFFAGAALFAVAVWAWIWYAGIQTPKPKGPLVLYGLSGAMGYLLGAVGAIAL